MFTFGILNHLKIVIARQCVAVKYKCGTGKIDFSTIMVRAILMSIETGRLVLPNKTLNETRTPLPKQ